jgi:hypothetical protein
MPQIPGFVGREGWLLELERRIEAENPGYRTYVDVTKSSLILSHLLYSDLCDCGAANLPLDFDRQAQLQGKYFLQLQEAVNVAVPWRMRYTPDQGSKRCLKLLLTDGVSHVVAVEDKPIPDLHTLGPAGIKLLIWNAPIRDGIIFLSPHNCYVLGGKVDYLEQARERAVKAWAQPVGSRGAPPETAAQAAQRLTAAAWNHDNNAALPLPLATTAVTAATNTAPPPPNNNILHSISSSISLRNGIALSGDPGNQHQQRQQPSGPSSMPTNHNRMPLHRKQQQQQPAIVVTGQAGTDTDPIVIMESQPEPTRNKQQQQQQQRQGSTNTAAANRDNGDGSSSESWSDDDEDDGNDDGEEAGAGGAVGCSSAQQEEQQQSEEKENHDESQQQQQHVAGPSNAGGVPIGKPVNPALQRVANTDRFINGLNNNSDGGGGGSGVLPSSGSPDGIDSPPESSCPRLSLERTTSVVPVAIPSRHQVVANPPSNHDQQRHPLGDDVDVQVDSSDKDDQVKERIKEKRASTAATRKKRRRAYVQVFDDDDGDSDEDKGNGNGGDIVDDELPPLSALRRRPPLKKRASSSTSTSNTSPNEKQQQQQPQSSRRRSGSSSCDRVPDSTRKKTPLPLLRRSTSADVLKRKSTHGTGNGGGGSSCRTKVPPDQILNNVEEGEDIYNNFNINNDDDDDIVMVVPPTIAALKAQAKQQVQQEQQQEAEEEEEKEEEDEIDLTASQENPAAAAATRTVGHMVIDDTEDDDDDDGPCFDLLESPWQGGTMIVRGTRDEDDDDTNGGNKDSPFIYLVQLHHQLVQSANGNGADSSSSSSKQINFPLAATIHGVIAEIKGKLQYKHPITSLPGYYLPMQLKDGSASASVVLDDAYLADQVFQMAAEEMQVLVQGKNRDAIDAISRLACDLATFVGLMEVEVGGPGEEIVVKELRRRGLDGEERHALMIRAMRR